MSRRWFRMYEEVLDDPKVQKLDDATFKAWVNLLCLASRNDGFLPPLHDVAFALRMDEHGARAVLERCLNATLIDKHSGGVDGYRYAPHGWDDRQYKSDTSTERVKRFRERSKTATVTPPEQRQTQSQNPPVSPVKTPSLPADVRSVLEEGGFISPPPDIGLLQEWYAAGATLDQDVLPCIRSVRPRLAKAPFKLKVFDGAIREKLARDEAEIAHLRKVAQRNAEPEAAAGGTR